MSTEQKNRAINMSNPNHIEFDLKEAIELLRRTPQVLQVQLTGLSDEWIKGNEGPGTWSPLEIIAHLIVNEETNFLTRTLLILSDDENKTLAPINMTVHLEGSRGRNIVHLLSEFSELRRKNIETLKSLNLSSEDLKRTAIHPKLGMVCLSNVLSTWVAHDLTHIGQITRVLAKKYRQEVGPFTEFLTRLK
jgi:DinB superfamily